MKKLLKVAAVVGSLAVTGCHQIYFHNGGPAVDNKDAAQYSEWHHGGVFGLVEFSEPVDVKSRCKHGWNTVQTENSFLTGLVSGASYSLYTPRKANLVCHE